MGQVSLTGSPIIAGQDVYTESADPQMNIGVYAETQDGRGYRYSKIGGVATVAGKVYQSAPRDATNQTPSGGLSIAAADAGAKEVVLTSSVTLAANLLAGGYMSVGITPGAGHIYRIKGNSAVSGAAGCVISLEDPIRVALTTSSKVIVAAHPYSGLVVEPGTATAVIAGVATHVITASYYGWVQTHGVASVLFTGTGVAGKAVGSIAGGTAGSAAPCVAATNILGYHLAVGITTEYALINLCVD
jgi:hypothetical protein